MKFVNLGCGSKYIESDEWMNIDFISNSKHVLAHDLRTGIPVESDSVDLVYHSHVLEHFTQESGRTFIEDCYRVLNFGGVIRIVIPDLEQIIRLYLKLLENGVKDTHDLDNKEKYDWILLELFDQMIRTKSGGQMAHYLSQEVLPNEEFIFERIGEEAKNFRKLPRENALKKSVRGTGYIKKLLKRAYYSIKLRLSYQMRMETDDHFKIGYFRSQGQIHQWMYDRYSMHMLLKEVGFTEIKVTSAFESYIKGWEEYELDTMLNEVRKPDSLFIEAIKN